MAARIQALEAEVATLRSIQANSNKRQFGAKSEQQNKAPSARKRGQQPGGHGHGRTPRPALEANTEVHEPAPEALRCRCCDQPYAPNGMHESELIEIEVQAHKRVLRRPRYRATCECAHRPPEVAAPPVPRLDLTPTVQQVLPRTRAGPLGRVDSVQAVDLDRVLP